MTLHRSNVNPSRNSAPDDLDRLLAAHFAPGDEIAPSSGFALSVVNSLKEETRVPPPIPFPWRRVVPGLAAVLCVMIGFAVFALHKFSAAATGPGHRALFNLPSTTGVHLTTPEQALCWAVASVCVALAAVAGSIRLAGGRNSMRV